MHKIAVKLLSENQIAYTDFSLTQFRDDAMGKLYDVYLIDTGNGKYVMKSGEKELEQYRRWFSSGSFPVPKIWPQTVDGWFLMEYLPGKDLRGADAETVLTAAEALARLHSQFWIERPEFKTEDRYSGYYRRFISKFPEAPKLQETLNTLISRMETCPRTLIHDDLLPINVQITENGIRFMDWQYCGIFPYFMDICRLLVHEKGELGSSFPQDIRKAVFRRYYDTLILSGCTDLPEETYWNDIRLGTIAELVSCLQQEDRSEWKDFLWDYYNTIIKLSE